MHKEKELPGIDVNKQAQIATMELVAMNNTENVCTDVIFVGRVPFKGNKSVVTGKDLETTATVKMLNRLQENIQNTNMSTIYYSTNENASKDLENSENGWSTDVGDWQNIKSYMIVVNGQMEAGAILKYTYDFEIPEGLYYDQAMYGSFGGFYNNNSKVAVYYESAEADKVGIVTKSSLPIKLKLDVDVGDKEEVKTSQYLNYILTVSNEGPEGYSGITINAQVPEDTTLYERSQYDGEGNNGYAESNQENLSWTIDNLNPGEVKEFIYMVKVKSFADEDNKIENTVNMTIGSLNNERVTSNRVENTVKNANFGIEVASKSGNVIEKGAKIVYSMQVANTEDKDSGKFDIVLNLPEGIEYESMEGIGESQKFDDKTRNLIITVNNLEAHYSKNCMVTLNVKKTNKRHVTLKPFVQGENGEIVYSTGTTFQTEANTLQISSATNFSQAQVVENQDVEIRYNIKNTGDADAKELNFELETSDKLENCLLHFESIYNGQVSDYDMSLEEKNFVQPFNLLKVGAEVQIVITGKIKNVKIDENDVLLSKLKVNGKNIELQEQAVKVSKIKDIDGNDKPVEEEKTEGIYEISGNVWIDENGDGQKVEEVQSVSAVQVQLLKNGNMIKATTTDNSGNYSFTGLAKGSYSVVYNYDKEAYEAGKYVKEDTEEIQNSSGYELKEGTSVSDEIEIVNQSLHDVNLGLQEKDKFDLQIGQSITKAIVDIEGEETQYEYADLDLAKIEIEPNKINKAMVKFEYKITVENVGNVSGKVTSIVDYLPAGMTFQESENEGWSNGVDGNLYNDSLREIEIMPGEVKELTLILSKKFNEDNTGVLSNKVKIAYTENDTRLTESLAGNFASQETIVSVTQGGGFGLKTIVTTISLIGLVSLFAYMIKTGKLDSKFNGKGLIKKVYK